MIRSGPWGILRFVIELVTKVLWRCFAAFLFSYTTVFVVVVVAFKRPFPVDISPRNDKMFSKLIPKVKALFSFLQIKKNVRCRNG